MRRRRTKIRKRTPRKATDQSFLKTMLQPQHSATSTSASPQPPAKDEKNVRPSVRAVSLALASTFDFNRDDISKSPSNSVFFASLKLPNNCFHPFPTVTQVTVLPPPPGASNTRPGYPNKLSVEPQFARCRILLWHWSRKPRNSQGTSRSGRLSLMQSVFGRSGRGPGRAVVDTDNGGRVAAGRGRLTQHDMRAVERWIGSRIWRRDGHSVTRWRV